MPRTNSTPIKRMIYLHGFRSSPYSFKAMMLRDWFAKNGMPERFLCPQLPMSPARAMALLQEETCPTSEDVLIGSSLGGYYATFWAQKLGCRTILLNPAVHAARDLASQVGEHRMYHSAADEGTTMSFKHEYVAELEALAVSRISDPERYFLIAAKGDEVLDWREMTAHYSGAKILLLEGSDHGLSDFAAHLSAVVSFAGLA